MLAELVDGLEDLYASQDLRNFCLHSTGNDDDDSWRRLHTERMTRKDGICSSTRAAHVLFPYLPLELGRGSRWTRYGYRDFSAGVVGPKANVFAIVIDDNEELSKDESSPHFHVQNKKVR